MEYPIRGLQVRAPNRARHQKGFEANEFHTLRILCLLDLQNVIVYLAKGKVLENCRPKKPSPEFSLPQATVMVMTRTNIRES